MTDKIDADTTVTILYKEEATKGLDVNVSQLMELKDVKKLDLSEIDDIDKLDGWIDENFAEIHSQLSDSGYYEDESADFEEVAVSQ